MTSFFCGVNANDKKETDDNKTNVNEDNTNNNRNKTIKMNPKGYSYLIQPNNQIYRVDKRRPNTQKLVQIDRVYGFFWIISLQSSVFLTLHLDRIQLYVIIILTIKCL